jgi:hypothetical protein
MEIENLEKQLENAWAVYQVENDKFVTKGNHSAGTRARKALAELAKLCKARRIEIQDIKNTEKAD